jgi:hypothetical protein
MVLVLDELILWPGEMGLAALRARRPEPAMLDQVAPDPAGLEGTAQEVRDFAQRTGIELQDVFRDVGITAPDQPYLPGFIAAVADLREHRAGAVVISSPGHLSLLP